MCSYVPPFSKAESRKTFGRFLSPIFLKDSKNVTVPAIFVNAMYALCYYYKIYSPPYKDRNQRVHQCFPGDFINDHTTLLCISVLIYLRLARFGKPSAKAGKGLKACLFRGTSPLSVCLFVTALFYLLFFFSSTAVVVRSAAV